MNLLQIYKLMIFEYKSLMEQLGNPTLGHDVRELNQVADLLAKEGAAKKIFGRTEIWQFVRCL